MCVSMCCLLKLRHDELIDKSVKCSRDTTEEYVVGCFKGDIINYGSQGSTKLGKFFCVFSLIPPTKVVLKRMIPPIWCG